MSAGPREAQSALSWSARSRNAFSACETRRRLQIFSTTRCQMPCAGLHGLIVFEAHLLAIPRRKLLTLEARNPPQKATRAARGRLQFLTFKERRRTTSGLQSLVFCSAKATRLGAKGHTLSTGRSEMLTIAMATNQGGMKDNNPTQGGHVSEHVGTWGASVKRFLNKF